MKNLTVRPLAFLFALFTFLLTANSLHAGASNKSGNPYGNGTFFPSTGTYNGVLRGVDIVGVTTFSTSTNTTISGGPLYIYNANTGLYSDSLAVYPIVNPSANILTAFIAPTSNTPSIFGTNASVGGGGFTANLSTVPPNQVFSGTGNLTQVIDTNTQATTNLPFAINGVRIGN